MAYFGTKGNPVIGGAFKRRRVTAASLIQTITGAAGRIVSGLVSLVLGSAAVQANTASSVQLVVGEIINSSFTNGTPGEVSLAAYFPAIAGTEQSIAVTSGSLPSGVTLDPIGKRLVYDGTPGVAGSSATITGKANAPKLSFSNATGTIPVIAGIAFPKGVVSSALGSSEANLRVVTRRTWNDGSIKHAVVVGTCDASAVVTFNTSPASGSNMSASDIAAAAPTAVVNLGSLGTADLSTLLATPFETWIATSKFVECHYRWTSSVNTAIAVEFQVRLWHNGALWVRANVENSKRIRTNGSGSYNVPITGTVTLLGTLVYTYSATALYENTQHIHERWAGATQYDIVVIHDVKQIVRTKLVPDYGMVPSITEARLNGLHQTYAINTNLDYSAAMQVAGYQIQIGVLPTWDVCYLVTGDTRAYRSVLANGKAGFNYSILWREAGRMLTPLDYPTANLWGVNQGGGENLTSGGLNWEMAHHPSMGFLPYILTGDAVYQDAMLGQVATLFQLISSGAGQVGTNRIMYWGQTRSTAWTKRTLAQAAALLHDGAAELAACKAWLNAHIDFYASKSIEEPLAVNSEVGYPCVVSTYNEALPKTVAPWMHNYWIGAMGYASDLDPVVDSDMVKLRNLRDWMYRGIVGFLGDGSTGRYCYSYVADYNITITSEVTNATRFAKDIYQSWGDVMTATHGAVACTNVRTWGSGEHTGDVGYAMSAIAYAMDHNAVGMDAAYARLTSITGWAAFTNNAWSTDPVWGHKPRATTPTSAKVANISIAGSRPAWRQAMVQGTWALVPGNKLSDIDPRNNPAINPNYPGAAPWSGATGQAAVVVAWCGACWDDETATFWIPLSGGHNDYFGNEPYKNCLSVDTPSWSMLRNPTGAIGNTGGVFNDGLEYTGVNWDGRFRACHSYNKPVYVPGRGPMMTILSSTSPNPSGPNYSLLLNETTGEMTHVATNSAAGGTDGGSAYDPSRNRLYWLGSNGARLTYLNCSTWSWTTLSGGTYHNDYSNQSLVYVPGKDVLVNLSAGTGVLSVFDPITGIRYQPGTSGTGGASLSGSGGAKWCQSLGCILYWHNSSNTTLITTITPPANPLTQPWVLGTLSVDPSNSVTPTSRNSNGTYGRFQVSEKLGVALLLNATNQQIYAFALD